MRSWAWLFLFSFSLGCSTPAPIVRDSVVEFGGSQEKYKGEVDKEAIRSAIEQNIHLIQDCYETELGLNPTAEGKVVIDFKMDDRGFVRSSKVKESTITQSRLSTAECVNSLFLQSQFPPPLDGKTAEVSYPFEFHRKR